MCSKPFPTKRRLKIQFCSWNLARVKYNAHIAAVITSWALWRLIAMDELMVSFRVNGKPAVDVSDDLQTSSLIWRFCPRNGVYKEQPWVTGTSLVCVSERWFVHICVFLGGRDGISWGSPKIQTWTLVTLSLKYIRKYTAEKATI